MEDVSDIIQPDHRYQREDRLRSKAEYERALARKCSSRGKHLLVYGIESPTDLPRLGRIVSKRWGNAVARNKIRRWMREAFRQLKHMLPKLDLVLIPVSSQGLSYAVILAELPLLATQVERKLGRSGSL